MNITDISELKNKISQYNSEYRIGNPLISDEEYDALLDSLREQMPADEFLAFRKTLTESAGKVTHAYKMGSLDKLKVGDADFSVKRWVEKNVPNYGDGTEGLWISSKIDGCSACLYYKDGNLISAATRGDGIIGVDITAKAMLFTPLKLECNWTGYIRGEITLTKQTIIELMELTKKTYKCLRNATAGLINAKEATDEEISTLRFFAYEVMGSVGKTKKEQFDILKRLGFETALYTQLTDIFADFTNMDFDKSMESVYNTMTDKAPFDIDGLVISGLYDDEVFEDEFLPKHTVAVKFNQMSAVSQLIDISWDVSKNGTLHPTGIISPVVLGGATVSNVTLNNVDYIIKNGLTYGCSVTVLKSGDIIPKIIDVSHPNPSIEAQIELPVICPSCKSAVEWKRDDLFPHCTNPQCSGMLTKRMLHLLRNLDVKNVAVKTLYKYKIYTVDNLLHIQNDGSAVIAKFIKELERKLFGASRETLLAAFDYDGVSSAIINKIIDCYGYEKVISDDFNPFNSELPSGVGQVLMTKFINGFKNIRDDFNSIISDERYYGESTATRTETHSGVLNGQGFVVTGDLRTMSRSAFKMKVITNGGLYQSGVSKKTSYLVCNDRESGTTKVKKALSLGVKVIDENEFITLLEGGNDFSIF